MRSCQINVKILTGNSSSLLLTTAMPATYNSMSRLSSQTLKMQSFVQLQLYLVATSTTRAVSTTWHKHHGDRYSSLVWCLSTRTTTTSECSVVWWMVLPFYLPVPDLTNGIHLLRTLCPDDPPEAAELLDYFDSTSVVDLDSRIQHKIMQSVWS